MANKPVEHIMIDPAMFKQELESKGLSIYSLGNPKSPNYTGLHYETIRKGLSDGWFSVRTIDTLSKIIDVNTFIIDPNYNHYDINLLNLENTTLKLENAMLKLEISTLKLENAMLRFQNAFNF